jgi:hypothetical protein
LGVAKENVDPIYADADNSLGRNTPMSNTPSHQGNADRTLSRWIATNCPSIASRHRLAQVAPPAATPDTPQAPAASPAPLSTTQPTPPISDQKPNAAPPAPKAVKTPITKENCKVTFDHNHIVIEIPNQPAINLSLTHDQQASVNARLAQDTFGTQGKQTSPGVATQPVQPTTTVPPAQ